MTPIIQEWIEKAESDFRVASRELKVQEGASLDAVCFHCQQCIEKYVKGFLEWNGIEFPKTHNLTVLLDLALPVAPLWESWRRGFKAVSDFAVEFRYPGEHATREVAKHAFAICDSFRKDIREIMLG
jgi:HEPN domain-containing protein